MESIAVLPAEQTVDLTWRKTLTTAELYELVLLVNFAVTDGGTLGYEAPMTRVQSASFTAQLALSLESGSAHALVGSVGKQYVFFCLVATSLMPNCRHRAELSKGVVHPLYRGRGLTLRALQAVVLKAEFLGIQQLVLDVREGSRAHALWQRFGFRTYGILEDYARLNEKSFRGHYMSQTVASLKQQVSPRLGLKP